MAETLSNISVIGEKWFNVYIESDIDSGSAINIQNTGVTDLFYSISILEPDRDSDNFRIFKRGEIVEIESGDQAVWVFSTQVDGLINVEINPYSVNSLLLSVIDLLQTISDNNSDHNDLILRELRLQNTRFEETFDTKIKASDI